MHIRSSLFLPATVGLLLVFPGSTFAQGPGFQIVEASIADIQGAIQKGERTCRQIVEAYIERAKVLLASDAASITDVCLEVGYSSLGSFSTLFAERAGCPPSAWRRRYVQVASAVHDHAAFMIPWCYARG